MTKPFTVQIVLPELLVSKTHPSSKLRCKQLKKVIVARLAWMSLTGKILVLFLHSIHISVNSLPSFSCQELLGLVKWHWLHPLQGFSAWKGELCSGMSQLGWARGRKKVKGGDFFNLGDHMVKGEAQVTWTLWSTLLSCCAGSLADCWGILAVAARSS